MRYPTFGECTLPSINGTVNYKMTAYVRSTKLPIFCVRDVHLVDIPMLLYLVAGGLQWWMHVPKRKQTNVEQLEPYEIKRSLWETLLSSSFAIFITVIIINEARNAET